MSTRRLGMASTWTTIAPRFLPFADAATDELPLGRLLRLSLFQITAGMAIVLLNGTLNRVMIVELSMPTWLVALMISIPLVFAPLRALIGYKSDMHPSVLGWRRVPYIWTGTLLQFGGLAIMPFALIVLSGDSNAHPVFGYMGAALAFLLVGAGLHTAQTAGLALATDLAPDRARPRVVALLYLMLLVGMIASAILFGLLLDNFSQVRLIKVIQGAAVVSMVLNVIAMWKMEPRNPALTRPDRPRPSFAELWQVFSAHKRMGRILTTIGLGTAAFTMQDMLLEPYGGEILHLSVADTTLLTALLATGSLVAFVIAARYLSQGVDPYRLAAIGILCGLAAFSAVIFAAPLESAMLFRVGTTLIGFGGGLFAVCTLCAAMADAKSEFAGMALGAWGAVQATAAGTAIALGGAVRDIVDRFAESGALGVALNSPATGYGAVYHIEMFLLFLALIAIGPLVRPLGASSPAQQHSSRFGLDEMPA